MTRYQKIEALLGRIILEKEKMDCEHVRKTAMYGCHCLRCKAARKLLTTRKP